MLIFLNSLFIFCLRVTDVSLGTIRTVMITRGHRFWAALIGFAEITIWVVAISKVISHLTHPAYVVGYAGGFATGTLVGMTIINRLSLGYVHVQIISSTPGLELVERIRKAGFGATMVEAQGQAGKVCLITVVISRKQLDPLLELVNKFDKKAFVTVGETPHVIGGYQRLAK